MSLSVKVSGALVASTALSCLVLTLYTWLGPAGLPAGKRSIEPIVSIFPSAVNEASIVERKIEVAETDCDSSLPANVLRYVAATLANPEVGAVTGRNGDVPVGSVVELLRGNGDGLRTVDAELREAFA